MFQIAEFTEARLTSVTNRTEKHGDEDKPAVSLSVEITAANTLLDAIDPNIRHALYKAVEGQDQLPGVEPATPVLRCNSFDTVALTTAHEGWRLLVDDSIDDTTPMEFAGVKVDKLRVDAKQGGSVVLKVRLGTSDVDADRLGKLGMHNGQAVWIKILPPEKAADAIDGSTEAFKKDHPDATDLFTAGAGTPGPDDDGDDVPPDGADEGSEGGPVEHAEQPTDPERGEHWPFGTDGGASGTAAASGETNGAESGTAGDADAFEAGAARAIREAGVRPKRAPVKPRGRGQASAGAVE